MADRRIKTILEAQIDGLRKGLQTASKLAAEASSELDDLEKRAKALDKLNAKVTVDADADKAEAAVERVSDELAKIDGESVSADVLVDSNKAEASVNAVGDRLAKIDGETASAKVTADAGKAEAELDSIAKKVSQLDGDGARIDVKADTSGAVDQIGADIPKAGKLAGGKAGDLLGGGLKGGLKVGLGALGGVALAGGAALGAAVVAGIQRGMDVKATQGLFSAKTGLDAETAAKFGRAAGSAYAQAWGESTEANLETARVALQNQLLLPTASQAGITDMVAKLTAVTDIIGADIPEAAEAAGNMIKSGLAGSADEAFDVIVAGYQRGADRSGDFLDTLREYSSMFQTLGLDGPTAVGLITQAMEAGARTSDLAADALKEFSIRAQDGSEASAEGFKLIGLNAKEMTKAIAEGGPAAEEALGKTLDALRKIEDPVQRNAAGVALLGTQWEDMGNGAAVLAMNLGTLDESWGNAAGAAERAMTAMSDNTKSKMEAAKRNIEVAMDGIAGILATAFADDIGGIAEWVGENRATIMEFAVTVTGALVSAGRGMADFAGLVIRGAGLASGALAGIVEDVGKVAWGIGYLSGNKDLERFGAEVVKAGEGMRTFADEAGGMADGVVAAMNGAMDGTERAVMGWAGDELLAAQISDAVTMSTRRLGELATAIDSTEGTVTINGESVNAERALDLIVANINESDGTVTINGDRVPAKQALDTIIGLVNDGRGDITIGGDSTPGRREVDDLSRYATSKRATLDVGADTSDAGRAVAAFINSYNGRTIRINVRTATAGYGLAGGGWTPGLQAGGWVPGPYPGPGKDNILWPLASGGQTLQQPLAGGEFVTNAVASKEWAPLLEAINGGLKPSPSRPASASDGAVSVSLAGATIHATVDGTPLDMRIEGISRQVVRAHDVTTRRVHR